MNIKLFSLCLLAMHLQADYCDEEICEVEPVVDDLTVYISGSALYWTADETGLPFAIEIGNHLLTPSDPASPLGVMSVVTPENTKYFNLKWDPSWRAGIGVNSCTGWDLFLQWTHFQQTKSANANVPTFSVFPAIGQTALVNPWVPFSEIPLPFADDADVTTPVYFQNVHASWDLTYNLIDLTLSRSFFLNPCIYFNPFLGVRGGWTEIHFKTRSFSPAATFLLQTASPRIEIVDSTATFHDSFENNFWGAGIFGGIQPVFNLGAGFSLWGDCGVSLLMGQFKQQAKSNEAITIPAVIEGGLFAITFDASFINNANGRFSGMQAIFDLGAGISWKRNFGCNNAFFAIDLSAEGQVWLNHVLRHKNYALGSPHNFSPSADGPAIAFFQKADDTFYTLALGGLVGAIRIGW